MAKKKIVTVAELNKELDNSPAGGAPGKREKAKKTIVFTNGCFDLLHLGHIRYLARARALGDVLVVGLNSDTSVRRLKGAGRPIVGAAERAEVLAALESVDYIVIFDEATPERLIREIKPDIQVKGGDYLPSEIPEREVLEAQGGKLVLVPEETGHSTTNLIKRIEAGAEKTSRRNVHE